MAIIDQAFEIRQRQHQIKNDEAEASSGERLDRLGREYAIGREPAEIDDHFRHRLRMRIMKVMNDAAIAEIERQRRDEGDTVILAYRTGIGWFPWTTTG